MAFQYLIISIISIYVSTYLSIYLSNYLCVYIYIYIYIYIYNLNTTCPHGNLCTLGTWCTDSYIMYPKCKSYHEAIMVTDERACGIKIIHVLCSSCFAVISALWHTHTQMWHRTSENLWFSNYFRGKIG